MCVLKKKELFEVVRHQRSNLEMQGSAKSTPPRENRAQKKMMSLRTSHHKEKTDQMERMFNRICCSHLTVVYLYARKG